ncbi:response regulator [Sphingobium sp. B12D2B]|uniref:response regulator n=1 Tax=Sphingobium sp. B12D2B TaxID=2940577 RepID=UPI002224CF3B|nr:response regulator [Sphingobium sp. B12D2B]MCW2349758.1 CheY-like chemotaxis protein [Sphingobium sp. B12D2B]
MFFSKETQRIRRILIVEDEPLLAFDEEHTLQTAGYEVVATVDRFREATAIILEQGAVDLVVTDVRLAGVRSGVELARHARELGIAVLFATATCPEEARDQDIALGCLSKPFLPRDLIRAIGVCERVIGARSPGRLPAGLKLFKRN